jgi:hypothetical protein
LQHPLGLIYICFIKKKLNTGGKNMKTKMTKSLKIKRFFFAAMFVIGICGSGMAQSTQTSGHVGYRDTPAGISDKGSDFSNPNGISKLLVYYSANTINLSFEKPSVDNVNIRIYDLTGKLILSDIAQTSEVNINRVYNINGISNGLYIVQIYSSTQVISRKFFV